MVKCVAIGLLFKLSIEGTTWCQKMPTTVVVNSQPANNSAIVPNCEKWCHTLKTTGTGPSVYGIDEEPRRHVDKQNRFFVETWSRFFSPLKFHHARVCFPLPVDWPWEEEADAQGRWMGKKSALHAARSLKEKRLHNGGEAAEAKAANYDSPKTLRYPRKRDGCWGGVWCDVQGNLCGHVHIRATPSCKNLHISVQKFLQ